ncbi:hypothetical protein [Anaerobiospirillum sp. NML120449]|uniref:hypothetical protein n=1 Tax=Anaerobiospirillum sp. NML120449 TaxID=2932817 RepID=UPI001FF27E91|nr:hypothetical protein [Anaerobiospirillum sp. NML120449]MCK0526636.1 hypothetical protein [Anaerobiospirillum sp. NML120449]
MVDSDSSSGSGSSCCVTAQHACSDMVLSGELATQKKNGRQLVTTVSNNQNDNRYSDCPWRHRTTARHIALWHGGFRAGKRPAHQGMGTMGTAFMGTATMG